MEIEQDEHLHQTDLLKRPVCRWFVTNAARYADSSIMTRSGPCDSVRPRLSQRSIRRRSSRSTVYLCSPVQWTSDGTSVLRLRRMKCAADSPVDASPPKMARRSAS